MKALVGSFKQVQALVGAFSVITNLQMYLRFKLSDHCNVDHWFVGRNQQQCGVLSVPAALWGLGAELQGHPGAALQAGGRAGHPAESGQRGSCQHS